MMLQVLDDPTSVRLIVQTSYPDFSTENKIGNVYFMCDHGNCGLPNNKASESAYDYWQVSDSLGQVRTFDSNVALKSFLDSIKGLITSVWIESF